MTIKINKCVAGGHDHIMTLHCEVTFLANVGMNLREDWKQLSKIKCYRERFLMRQSLCRNHWSKQSNTISCPSVILTSHIHVHVVIM